MTPRQELPIGIQNLNEIIRDGYYYVDKTPHALLLIDQGKYYFRPRRFGKSLFLDTLKELFEGNEPLFRGLFIHDRWDWSRKNPVSPTPHKAGVLATRQEQPALAQQIPAFRKAPAKRRSSL